MRILHHRFAENVAGIPANQHDRFGDSFDCKMDDRARKKRTMFHARFFKSAERVVRVLYKKA